MIGNIIRIKLVLLLTLFLLAACGPTTARQFEKAYNAGQLSAGQVLELVEENTMLLVSFEEESYFYFHPSGRVYGIDIHDNKDIGKWDVSEGDELCMKMESWWFGYLKCFSVYSNDKKYALTDNSGVIAFNAQHFAGDLKNQYYEPKSEKKSYRRSARKRDDSREPENEAAKTNEQPVREQVYSAPVSDAELKATVKWMAKDCPGCNLANTNLRKADLVGAKLQGANLSGANLSMADMRRADLRNANLEGADLTFANMPGADLRNCNLRNANLKGANLIRADLTGADLQGARVEDALLEGTAGLQ
ncbi:MAG: pentapeptide repeat-containing protein [Desulfobulbaceae bacterium]|nr:pentapeptide repeat-containing protein [Desulfobulbaceae bacterium]